ncbi:transposase [Mesorhizobium sp.]|uniref:transposase n=1 Tax=Mesorhizobium sp. TaxID=1871066 RepID=UPI00267C1534
MTTQRVEVITSVERRRRWSREEKERLVAATLESGASVSEIARSARIHGKKTTVVCTAIARELVGFIWAVGEVHAT